MAWYSPSPQDLEPLQEQTTVITPTLSQHRMITSDATVVAIYSNAGEGKTMGAIMALIYHAYRGNVPLYGAVVRDTHENIKRTVVKAFENFFALTHMPYDWRNNYGQLLIHSQPLITLDLLGVDDLKSITRLQGAEYGLIWLEEPCAYTSSTESNAGLTEDLFNAALMRCTRQQNIKGKLLLSFNPPDEDHWVTRRVINKPDGMMDPRTPLITKETIRIPPGENVHLKEESRQGAAAAYVSDPVGYARFVRGDIATKMPGIAVTGRVFSPDWHVSKIPLEPQEGLVGWVGWDSWMHPAAVLGQQFPDGRLWVLDVIVDANDIRDLVRNQVNPLVQSPRWKGKCFGWRSIGDRTMKQPDQSNHSECAAEVVENEFDPLLDQLIPFELGPQTWPHLYNGVMHALRDTAGGGQPKVLINEPRCRPLIAGLKGRWHFPTNKSGVASQSMPLKNAASHPCDSFANAVCVLAPWSFLQQSQYTKKRRSPGYRRRARVASSYITRTPLAV